MPIFLIPIVILLGIFAVSAGGDILQNVDIPFLNLKLSSEKSVEKVTPKAVSVRPSTISKAPSGASPPKTSPSTQTSPLFVLDTVITKGPREGTKINDTNVVTFEFEGSVQPTNTPGRITFETKVKGVDENWKATSSRQRKITLPTGQHEYTFLVRAKINEVVDQTPAQRTFSVAVSPYFGKVDISTARPATSSSASFMTLRPRLKDGESINLTGFKIEGRNGSFTIPLGIKEFRPGVGDVPINPIVVTSNDTVKISGARGPFGLNRNFRPNKCMGYLKTTYTFPLSFSTSCSFQKPLEKEILFLPIHCQDFVLKKINFSSCKVPQYPEDPNVLQEGTAECAAYLQENFTYTACFQQYSKEPDFFKSEWHIYSNTDFINPRYDVVKLFDQQGLLVDTKEVN